MNVRKGNYEKVAEFVKNYSRENGRSVDLLTIIRETGVPKTSAARYLDRLVDEGIVVHAGRNGFITRQQLQVLNSTRSVPCCGPVSCGIPQELSLDAAEYTWYSFPADLLGSGEYFLLEAEGDALIEDGIFEGDLLLIRAQPEPDLDRQIVVATVGGETLLRHIHIDGETGCTELIPANSSMQIVRCRHGIDEDVIVQGVAIMKLSKL